MQNLRAILLLLSACLATAKSFGADPLDTWHLRLSGTLTNLNGVDYSAGIFVAVGDGGTICRSDDGTNWTNYSVAPNPHLYSISHSNGLFAVVGEGGCIYTSPDGWQWTQQTSPTTNKLYCIRWVRDRFLAGGAGGTLLSSLNGVDWEVLNSGIPTSILALAYGNGLFMALGTRNAGSVQLSLSTDAVAWTNMPASFEEFYTLHHNGDRFVSLGFRGRTRTTTNGVDWTPYIQASATPNLLVALAHQHGRLIAVGTSNSLSGQVIFSSVDGFSWRQHPINVNHTGPLYGVAGGAWSVVAVGLNGVIVQSAPTFRLLPHPQIVEGERVWTLHGQSGRPYRFQYAPDASSGPWLDLTSFTATNDVITLRDPLPSSPTNRFYRVATP